MKSKKKIKKLEKIVKKYYTASTNNISLCLQFYFNLFYSKIKSKNSKNEKKKERDTKKEEGYTK